DRRALSPSVRAGGSTANPNPANRTSFLWEEAPMNIDTTVWYHIVNVNSNRMLEVPGDGVNSDRLKDGVVIRQGDLVNSADTQWWSLWKFVSLPVDKYHIFNKGSGRCMVIENGSVGPSVPVWQYEVTPERAQEQWMVTDVPNGNGKVYLINVKSNR